MIGKPLRVSTIEEETAVPVLVLDDRWNRTPSGAGKRPGSNYTGTRVCTCRFDTCTLIHGV